MRPNALHFRGYRRMASASPLDRTEFRVRALLVGERLDLRALTRMERMANDPLTITAGAAGFAILFRYGAVVLFDLTPLEESEFLRQLAPLVQRPYAAPEIESIDIRVDPDGREGLEGAVLTVADSALERFQIIADILSKSTVLALYESRVTRSFDLVEPIAADLEQNAGSRRTAKELLRQIGSALLSEQNMVGRVQVVDKPDLLWEHPRLERFYLRLEDEFEIRDRHMALERKLELVARTAQTVLEVLQDRRNLRVEWYIVILIVVEILLTLYQMYFHGR